MSLLLLVWCVVKTVYNLFGWHAFWGHWRGPLYCCQFNWGGSFWPVPFWAHMPFCVSLVQQHCSLMYYCTYVKMLWGKSHIVGRWHHVFPHPQVTLFGHFVICRLVYRWRGSKVSEVWDCVTVCNYWTMLLLEPIYCIHCILYPAFLSDRTNTLYCTTASVGLTDNSFKQLHWHQ